LLAHGRWFTPGTLVSSSTKTSRHDIVKSGVKHQKYKKKQSRKSFGFSFCTTLKICLLRKNIKSIGELLVPVKEMFENAE
jgi:hypothetical protein